MSLRFGLMTVLILLVAACSRENRERVAFDGAFYQASLSKDRDDRRAFTVAVRSLENGLTGAREAGRYEATKYCIDQYGTSRVDWVQGPDVADEELVIANGELLLAGLCAP